MIRKEERDVNGVINDYVLRIAAFANQLPENKCTLEKPGLPNLGFKLEEVGYWNIGYGSRKGARVVMTLADESNKYQLFIIYPLTYFERFMKNQTEKIVDDGKLAYDFGFSVNNGPRIQGNRWSEADRRIITKFYTTLCSFSPTQPNN